MLVFIRGVTESLSVHEDLLELVSLHSTTRGLDVKVAVLKLLRDRVPDLPLSKLVGLTTDGAPSMTGKENGAVSLLKKHLRESKFEQDILTVHCVIHQEALCAKTHDACNGISREMRERNTCKRVETSAVSVISGKCKCTI